MKYENRQRKAERTIYESIDEISEELNINISSYPEVYLINKKADFCSLGLPESYREDFEEVIKEKTAKLLIIHNLVLTATNDIAYLAEEAGHFIHFKKAGINLLKAETENAIDCSSIKIIGESIGYFCSKLIHPERKNVYNYKTFRNFIFTSLNKKNLSYKSLDACIVKNYNLKDDFFIYKNGYGIGERMFNEYIQGTMTKEYITDLIKNPFKEDFSATKKLFSMLKRFPLANCA